MTSNNRPKALSPVEVWEEFLDLEDFATSREEVLPSLLEAGDRKDVLLISGENAGGKSLAIMIINQLSRSFAKQDGSSLEVMDIGMHRRTEGGVQRALMFGDEAMDSTGNISIKVVQGGLSTSKSRDGYHYLILDEPDIGVGEGYHNALGDYLGAFARDLPEKCLGFIVATHSRRVANKLLDAGASSLRLGADLRPARTWVEHGDLEKSVEDLLSLKQTSVEKMRLVSAMLSGKRKTSAPSF